ncbi:transposase [Streptomyces sp. NPDC059866]|uniref:transposase n=1 Tax=Streptomyces sp. NPDC059866 TaxID=3346978 RepID=UPI00365338E5
MVSRPYPGRLRSEAAFASFAGVSPIPASSGLTNRHRINRSGDRQLNRALHTITLIRMRLDPATKTYVARRIAEGKTSRDAQRCLKRTICRQLFKILERSDRTSGRNLEIFLKRLDAIQQPRGQLVQVRRQGLDVCPVTGCFVRWRAGGAGRRVRSRR